MSFDNLDNGEQNILDGLFFFSKKSSNVDPDCLQTTHSTCLVVFNETTAKKITHFLPILNFQLVSNIHSPVMYYPNRFMSQVKTM